MVKNAMKMRSGITVSFLPPLVDSSIGSMEALEKLAQVLDRCKDIPLFGFALLIGDCYGIDALGNLWIDRKDGVESWVQFLRQMRFTSIELIYSCFDPHVIYLQISWLQSGAFLLSSYCSKLEWTKTSLSCPASFPAFSLRIW
jgi:hypothetical protein